MSQHIPPALLTQFIEGRLEEPVAVAVANHLDECSRCSAAAAAGDPLSPQFASIDDPPIPDGLVASIVDAAEKERLAPKPRPKKKSNAALFVLAACVLLAVAVSPDGLLTNSEATLGDAYGPNDSKARTHLIVGITVGLFAGAWIAIRTLKRKK